MSDVDELDDFDSGPEPDDVCDRNYSPGSAQGSGNEAAAVVRHQCVKCLGGGGGCFPPPEGWAVAWGFKRDNRGGRGFWRFCVMFENWSAAKGMSENNLKDLGFDTDAYRMENPDREYARLVFGNHMRTDMLDPNPKRLSRFRGSAPTPSRLPVSPMTLRHRSGKRAQTSQAGGDAKRGKHRAVIEDSDDGARHDGRPSRQKDRHASHVSDSVIGDCDVDDNVIPQLPLNREVDRHENVAGHNGSWVRNATPGPSRLPGRDDQEVDGLVTSGQHEESDEQGNGPVEVTMNDHRRRLTAPQTQVSVKSPEEPASTSSVLPAAGSPSGPRLDLSPPPGPHVLDGAAVPPPASIPIAAQVDQPQLVPTAAPQQSLQQQNSPAEVNRPNAPVHARSIEPKVEPTDGNLAFPLQAVVGHRGVSDNDDDDGYFEITGIKPPPLPPPRIKVEPPSSTIGALPTPAASSSAATDPNVPPAAPVGRQPINRPIIRRQPHATPGPRPVTPGWKFGAGVNLVEEPVLDLVVSGTFASLYTTGRQPALYGPRCRGVDGSVVRGQVMVDVVRTKEVVADMEHVPIMAIHTVHRVAVNQYQVKLPVIAIGKSDVVVIYIRLDHWMPFHAQFYDPSAPNPSAQHSFQKDVDYHFVFTLDKSVKRPTTAPRCPPPSMVDHLLRTIVDNFRHGNVVKITLIGCEDWPRGWCGQVKPTETIRAYCTRMFTNFLQEARFHHFASLSWDAHELLRFITMAEYQRYWNRRQATFGALTKDFYRE
ncbi:hypothetical protein CcaverHIS631_0702310 [Cutaneotrichosporon cavernicola]|nr:hypothetical protein CcaverHIS631_0702310 [Cutaneotrichosporon cavernicola]BEJ10195.1 hypothetical protein CcaverHIS641_0702300 [Cutaneotrichosporon cavernicola]